MSKFIMALILTRFQLINSASVYLVIEQSYIKWQSYVR